MVSILSTIKNEVKGNLSLSVPLIASQFIYACSGFIGTVFIAKLGEDALAASVLVSTIWMTLSVFFFGILNAVSILVSHRFGAKNHQAISEVMGQSYLIGIFLTLIMIVILQSMPWFLHWTTQPLSVLTLSYQYMYALLWTIPGLIALIIIQQFLAGINRGKLVLHISILVVPVEITLIYLLIFGKLGLPAYGVAGIGYGFATTYSLTTILLVIYLLKSKQYQPFKICSGMIPIKLHYWKEIITIGLPMGFMHVIEVSTFTVATFWIARFGTTMLAAHQIVLQYLGLIITMVFGMSQAVTVRVGHAIGRQDLPAISYAAFVGMFLNSIFIVCIAIGFFLAPKFFLSIDINLSDPNNVELIRDASMLLIIGGVLLICDNIRIIGFGALRGLKDTRFPMYAAFIGFWMIGLVCAYLFGFILPFQGKGIWWGLTVGIASCALIVLARVWYMLSLVIQPDLGKTFS